MHTLFVLSLAVQHVTFERLHSVGGINRCTILRAQTVTITFLRVKQLLLLLGPIAVTYQLQFLL